jgi:hypothetical protein
VIRELLFAALLVSGLAAAQPCDWPSFALPVDLGIPIEERWPQLRTARVDGDGRQDLLAFIGSGHVVAFWNRAGTVVRGPSTEQLPDFPVNGFPLEPADLDDDGRMDLFVGVSSAGEAPRRFESWLGDGAGGLPPSTPAPFGWVFRLVDVDADGRNEVLYAIWQPVLSDAGILRREADGTWRVLGTWPASAQSLLVGELDRNPPRKRKGSGEDDTRSPRISLAARCGGDPFRDGGRRYELRGLRDLGCPAA